MQLKNLTREAIAELTGIDKARLSRIFNGQSISENTIKRFAIALEVPPKEAYSQIEEMRAKSKPSKGNTNVET